MENFEKSNADRYECGNPIKSEIKYFVIKVEGWEPLIENKKTISTHSYFLGEDKDINHFCIKIN